MRQSGNKPTHCAEPGCKLMGQVRIVGNNSWFCFQHKPLGKMR